MAGYDDTRQKILNSLMQRPDGTEILPENHQDFALSLLDYIRNVELIAGSTLIGTATTSTFPVQPDTTNVAYVASVGQSSSVTFNNFRGYDGNPLRVTTTETTAKLVILLWNKQYWSKQEVTVTSLKLDIQDIDGGHAEG